MSVVRNATIKQESRSYLCFVCGGATSDCYPLHTKSRSDGPFYPFLEHHQPPSGMGRPGVEGIVGACYLCYSFLSQQWDNFERSGTPHVKRLYWLKRVDNGPFAGMDSGVQSEYASHFLGIPTPSNHMSSNNSRREAISPPESSNQSTIHFKQEYNTPEPLDCSLLEDLRSKPLPIQRNEASENTSVLDLSVQTKPISFPEASCASPNLPSDFCYNCGEENPQGSLVGVYCKPVANYPYFPALSLHPKPHKAKAIDPGGKVEVCDRCQKYLIRQWETYQKGNVPNMERHYHLSTSRQTETIPPMPNLFICFTCGQEYPRSVCREIKAFPNSGSEPYFRFLEKYLPPPGAQTLSNDGHAVVCSLCYKSLYRQFHVYQVECTPEEQRTYKVPAEYVHEPNVLRERLMGSSKIDRSPPTLSCYLCERSTSNLKYVDTLPHQTKMFFSFIREISKLPSTEPMDQQGRVLVCGSCFHLLQTQWDSFQNAQVPHNQRNYSVQAHGNSHRILVDSTIQQSEICLNKNPSSALHITLPDEQIPMNHHHLSSEPLLTTVTTMSYGSHAPSKPVMSHHPQLQMHKENIESSRSQRLYGAKETNEEASESVPRICNPLEFPSAKPPLMVATNCFVCGETSASGCTYSISAYPLGNVASEELPNPFFPFLTKHVPPPNAEMPAEDGTVLVCTFCFHSLMAQWVAYETSPHPEDANCWTRKYNTYHYVCYICGITTYRKRGRSITVKDFPFLVEHPRPPGALTLQNGESVVTCLTCFESLMSQWKDFERMKLPVEIRKYNWIVIPPPENERNPTDRTTNHSFQKPNRDLNPSTIGPTHNSSASERSHPNTPDLLSRHDSTNTMGLGHGVAKPQAAMLNMQQQLSGCSSGSTKPASVRTMATAVSPMYPVGPPPQGPHGSAAHNMAVFNSNPANSFNAARTSSFAAALRKLAKQAVDPVTVDKELSPITPVSSPALSQRSTTPKRPMPPGSIYLNSNHHHPASSHNRIPSPSQQNSGPISNSHSVDNQKPLDLGPLSSLQPNAQRENNSRLNEPLSLKLDSNKNDKRSSRPDDHQSSGRGFQPYRGMDENRHSHPSHPSHNTHVPVHYDVPSTAYPYHPAFLPQHLAHPAYSNRLKIDERHSTRDSYSSEHDAQQRSEYERRYHSAANNGRGSSDQVTNDGEEQRNSPLPPLHMSRHVEAQGDRRTIGSITQGTPRDLRLSGPSRSPESPTPSAPLNLAMHHSQDLQRTRHQDVELWVSRQASASTHHERPDMYSQSIPNVSSQQHHPAMEHHPVTMSYSTQPSGYSPMHQSNGLATHHEEVNKQYQLHVARQQHQMQSNHQRKPYLPSTSLNQTNNVESNRTLESIRQMNHEVHKEKYAPISSYETPVSVPNPSFNGAITRTEDWYRVPPLVPAKDQSLHYENKTERRLYQEVQHLGTYESEKMVLSRDQMQIPVNNSLADAGMNKSIVVSPVSRVTFERTSPNLTSELDLAEIRLRQARQNGRHLSDNELTDEEESDGSEEQSPRDWKPRTYLKPYFLCKGPPSTLDTSPKKMEVLRAVGLISHRRKTDLLTETFLRRYRNPKHRPPLKVLFIENHDSQQSHIPELYFDALEQKSNKVDSDIGRNKKSNFFEALGLQASPDDRKEEQNILWRAVLRERCLRYQISVHRLEADENKTKDTGDVTMLPRGKKRKASDNSPSCINGVDSPVEVSDPIASELPGSLDKPLPGNYPADIQNSNRETFQSPAYYPPPPLVQGRPLPKTTGSPELEKKLPPANFPPATPTLIKTGSAVLMSNGKQAAHHRQMPREFVQEFHQLVLETTKQKLEHTPSRDSFSSTSSGVPPPPPLLPSSQNNTPANSQHPSLSNYLPNKKSLLQYSSANNVSQASSSVEKSKCSEKDVDYLFEREQEQYLKWPGIEVIMESYEKHRKEQSAEREFLEERCQVLYTRSQELDRSAEMFRLRMTELLQLRTHLDEERDRHQTAIDSLKKCLRQVR